MWLVLVAGLDQLGQFASAPQPLRSDDADLGQVAAQPIEKLRALRDQHPAPCDASTPPGSRASARRQTASRVGSPPRRSPTRPMRRSSAGEYKASHKPEASSAPHDQA